MKKVCQKCGENKFHKHGKKRRKCINCGTTCRIKSGRRKTRFSEMYLLDRSTIRRISKKIKFSPAEIMRKILMELKSLSTPLSCSKNFTYLQWNIDYRCHTSFNWWKRILWVFGFWHLVWFTAQASQAGQRMYLGLSGFIDRISRNRLQTLHSGEWWRIRNFLYVKVLFTWKQPPTMPCPHTERYEGWI